MTKRCEAIHPDYPMERCGDLDGHLGDHSYHPSVDKLWVKIEALEWLVDNYKKVINKRNWDARYRKREISQLKGQITVLKRKLSGEYESNHMEM